MKIPIHTFWIVALHCAIAPLTCPAQNVTLINTYTNPAPASGDNFGYSVAAVGSDRVLIGAPFDSRSALYEGAAYLFSTNGTLLTTFTNPAPTADDRFGISLAAVGNDRVIIGARSGGARAFYSGVAYLFNTNGTLCMTFTNPTPASDQFGLAVAAVRNDRVLIGAFGDDTGASGAEAAYLFNTNGTLLVTFTNPTPASSDFFGNAVATLGSDRVLIGAYLKNTGATDAGVVYLFSTTGALLNTITNPTPAVADYFGNAVTALGNDRVLIGAYQDNTGASDAGSAYLYSAPPAVAPSLFLVNPKCSGTNFTFWFQTQSRTSYTLGYNCDLSTTNWTFVQTIPGNGSLTPCLIPMTNSAQCLFRVRQP